jgi:hypothetical protein
MVSVSRELLERIASELYVRGADGAEVYEDLISVLHEQPEQVEKDDGEDRHLSVLALHDVMQSVPSSSLYSLAEAVLDAGYFKVEQPAPVERQAVAEVRSSALGCVDWISWPNELKDGTKLYAEQPAPVAVAPDLTELRDYHANAVTDLENYADDSGLRESDVKHYRKRANFHRKQVELIDSLNNN